VEGKVLVWEIPTTEREKEEQKRGKNNPDCDVKRKDFWKERVSTVSNATEIQRKRQGKGYWIGNAKIMADFVENKLHKVLETRIKLYRRKLADGGEI
jgi:hypothetical protein